jgi:hypothetical protein
VQPVEAQPIEAPVAEAPVAEAREAEVPEAEAPKAEAPQAESPPVNAPPVDAPLVEAPSTDTLNDRVLDPLPIPTENLPAKPKTAALPPSIDLRPSPSARGFSNRQVTIRASSKLSGSQYGDKTMALLKDESLTVAEREVLAEAKRAARLAKRRIVELEEE